ncbi:MAG: hypothetical protein RLZZ450_4445 [Pseudomonadota bacterium]|jgi:AraC-like DNA-binding protein
MWLYRSSSCSLVVESLARPSQLHDHHVVQLTIGLSQVVHAVVSLARGGPVRFDDGDVLPPMAGILIAPNVSHTLHGDVVHIFAEPLGPLGRQLRGLLAGRPYLALDANITREFLGDTPCLEWLLAPRFDDTEARLRALLAAIGKVHGSLDVVPVDTRIDAVIATLRSQLDLRTPLEQLADVAHLSPSRLTHLFTREVGLPIKQYLVWLRLVAVLESLGSGQQLGTLAHATGFPDQPAFARSYRKAWGRTPSAFRRAARESAS